MAGYDLPGVEVEIFVDAPPQRVWELVTDIVLLGEWSPEYDGGEWLDSAAGPRGGGPVPRDATAVRAGSGKPRPPSSRRSPAALLPGPWAIPPVPWQPGGST